MKKCITQKIGYTAGIYGCTNEYFSTTIIDGDRLENIIFYGLYGSEERVFQALKDKGFEYKYVWSVYGRLVRKDIPKNNVYSEHSAIEYINTSF
jgi:hypothetical protein